MLIDTHCHLLHRRYRDEPPPLPAEQLVEDARVNGVTACIAIACERHEWAENLAFAATHPGVFVAAGIHPYHAGDGGLVAAADLLELAQNPKVVGLGETGLDYHRADIAARPDQRASFHTHFEVAEKTGLPVIIHTREAEADTLAVIAAHPGVPFVLHCFSGSPHLAEKAVGQGGYISFSGILTFKKSQQLCDIAAGLPREKVLLETDAPYLAPEPHRSRRNAPALLPHTAQVLADVWRLGVTDVAQITSANARRLFTRLPTA